MVDLKSFSDQRSDSASKLSSSKSSNIWGFFLILLYLEFCSKQSHSGTQITFKDTQRTLKQTKHSESTRTLTRRRKLGTRRTPEGRYDTGTLNALEAVYLVDSHWLYR